MRNKSNVLSRVKNGELALCRKSHIYSLTFNNLFFQFNEYQLLQFREYLNQIDIQYWLNCYACSIRKRKIPITTPNQTLVLFFNEDEMQDLKALLSFKKRQLFNLSASEIDYTLVLN